MDSCGAESGSGPPPLAKSTPTMFRCVGPAPVEPLPLLSRCKFFPDAEESGPLDDMTDEDTPLGDWEAKYEVGGLMLKAGVIGLRG